jgi:putative DNA primase/helicase
MKSPAAACRHARPLWPSGGGLRVGRRLDGSIRWEAKAPYPKRQDDWAVVPTLCGLAVGAPGSMKSPALAEALRPLRRLVTDAQARDEEHRLAQRMRVAEQKARRHELARRLREAVANQEPPEALQEPVEPARREPPPVEQRYLVNDTTVEKLGTFCRP